MNWQIIWNHFQKTNKKESRSLWTIRIKMIRQTKKIIMKRTLIKQTLLLAMKKSNWEIMEGIIGKKKAKEVRRSLGGENTYVPKEGEEDDIKARNDKIYEKFLLYFSMIFYKMMGEVMEYAFATIPFVFTKKRVDAF